MYRNLKGFAAAVLLAAPVMLMASTASGQDRLPMCGRGQGGPDGPDGPDRWERLCERLDLNAEQKTAIEEIRQENRAKRQELRKELLRLRHELKGELLKDDPSAKTAKDLVARIGELKIEMQQGRLAQQLAIRQLLTDEQRDQLLLLRAERPRPDRKHGCGLHDRSCRPGCRHDADSPRSGRHGGPRRQGCN